ncbi:hypothetical protein JQ611_26810 [Bradyrhizobium sp. AUGA SZCCT0182]|nr:hypothetical protein [Bradyrhizobium sp. AUGA SZCCT0182]
MAEVRLTGPVDPDIPREGRLFFFYDTDHRPAGDKPGDITGARLIYDLTPVDSLKRASPPAELWAHKQTAGFRPQRCALHAGMWPPYFGSPEWNACEIKARAEKTVQAWWYEVTRNGHDHRFGGHIRSRFRATCRPNARSSARGSTPARGIRRRPSG